MRFSSSERKEMYFFSFKLVLFFLFVIAIVITAGITFGYKYDVKKQFLFKTSIIALDSKQDIEGKLNVYLDRNDKYLNKFPFQISSVKPGRHDLIIETEGYFPWSKSIIVKEDIVSEYSNILFVPTNIESYNSILVQDSLEKVAEVDRKMVFYNRNLNYYKYYNFDNKENPDINFIESILEEPEGIDFLGNNFLQFNYSGNKFKVFNLDIGEIKDYDFNDEYKNVIFDTNLKEIFFIENNGLYFLELSENNLLEKSVLLKQDIDTFEIIEDKLFFIKDNKAGYMNLPVLDNIQYTILEGETVDPVNSFFAQKLGESFLLISNDNRIYQVDLQKKSLSMITDNVTAFDIINDGYLLYTDGHEVILYDSFDKSYSVIIRLESFISDLSFYYDLGHILFITDNSIKIVDRDGGNMYTMFEIDPDSKIMVVGDLSQIVYKKDSGYKIFDL